MWNISMKCNAQCSHYEIQTSRLGIEHTVPETRIRFFYSKFFVFPFYRLPFTKRSSSEPIMCVWLPQSSKRKISYPTMPWLQSFTRAQTQALFSRLLIPLYPILYIDGKRWKNNSWKKTRANERRADLSTTKNVGHNWRNTNPIH